MSFKILAVNPINPANQIATGTWAIGQTPYQGLEPLSFNSNTFSSTVDQTGTPYFVVDSVDPSHIRCVIPNTYTAVITLTAYPSLQGTQPTINTFLYTNIQVNENINLCDIWPTSSTSYQQCSTVGNYPYFFKYYMNKDDYFIFLIYNDNQMSSPQNPVKGTIAIYL